LKDATVLNALMRLKNNLALRIALGSWAAFSGLNAQAAPESGVAPAFGNTVVSTYPDGRTQKIWLHEDGTWDGLSRRGNALAGKWTVKADKLCLRQSRPPTLPISYCTVLPKDLHPGVSLTSKDLTGTPIQLKLLKGIQKPGAAAN
jgi:hypothetical protein